MTTVPSPRPVAARHRPWPWCRQCTGIALDLGSARTRAWMSGRRSILDVPTVTAPGDSATYPVQRGTIVDTPGTARMLNRLLGHRLPRFGHPLLIVTTPVLGGLAYRAEARTAVEVLRPRTVLTVPTARAVAMAADADLTPPLLVLDIGAHLTEVTLLADGAVTDARHTALGTGDLGTGDLAGLTPPAHITDAVVEMVTAMLDEDRTPRHTMPYGGECSSPAGARYDPTSPTTSAVGSALPSGPFPLRTPQRSAAPRDSCEPSTPTPPPSESPTAHTLSDRAA